MFLYEVITHNISFILTMAVPFIAGYLALGLVQKFETEFSCFISYFGGVVLCSLVMVAAFDALDALMYMSDTKSIIRGLNTLTAFLMLAVSALVWSVVAIVIKRVYMRLCNGKTQSLD